jgi:hypothetical protein
MNPIQPLVEEDADLRVFRIKKRYGAAYGFITGLAFAISVWGADAYLLSRAHAFFPWLKLIIGMMAASIAGGIVGYLAIRFQRSVISFLLWLLASGFFAWLLVFIPLQAAPYLSRILEPELNGLLTIGPVSEFSSRVSIAFLWVVIFTSIVGVLEFPLVDSGVFSYSISGKFIPFLVCITIMALGGNMADDLSNKPLRLPIVSMNNTIQFALDHQDKPADPKASRDMHVASLRTVQDYISAERNLIVGSHDNVLEQFHVLIKFKKGWVDCQVLFGSPITCRPAVSQ